MPKSLLKAPARYLLGVLLDHPRFRQRVEEIATRVAQEAARERVAAQDYNQIVGQQLRARLHVPNLSVASAPQDGAFMRHSTCSMADFFHPRFAQLCALLHHPLQLHRKLWEWIFIVHHLREAGVLREGCRGVGFGVGRERLPAVFAGLGAQVTATDAPSEVGMSAGWTETGQHAASLDALRHPQIVPDAVFDRKVSYKTCDMREIDPQLTGYDFTWSSCCFEHLGSLDAGLQFVVDSVEKTLKPGGVACHTTEFNLSSDTQTVESGHTVLYRRRDILRLVETLRERGHEVQPFVIAPDTHYLDGYVDVPPYRDDAHLRLRLESHVATSAGIVVRRRA